MGRKKAIDPYDFKEKLKEFDNSHLDFVTKVLTPEQIIANTEKAFEEKVKQGKYVNDHAKMALNVAKTEGYSKLLGYQQQYLNRYSWNSHMRKEYSRRIMDWYASSPEAQEIYRDAAKTLTWFNVLEIDVDEAGNEHENWKYITAMEAHARGLHEKPIDGYNVMYVLQSSEGRKAQELKRYQPFMEGDIVLLRTPYHRHWDHDPHRLQEAGIPRYGTVMGTETGETDNWRSTRGSRLVQVVWFGKDGQAQKVPEKIIKLESRKGRQV